MPKGSVARVDVQPMRYWWTVGIVGGVHVITAAATPFLGGIHFDQFTIWNSELILALLGIYDLVSLQRVKTAQFGGITVLEKQAVELDSGWKFVPKGLTELHVVPRSEQEDQFPGDPEKIEGKVDKKEYTADMLKPMRIPTAGPAPGSDDSDILDVRLTLEPTIAILWQVQRKGFFEFFINIDGDTWPEKRAFLVKQMRDFTETQLMYEFAQHTAGDIGKHLKEITDIIHTGLQEKMKDWGISICDVSIQSTEPPHAVNTALAEVPAARAKKIAITTEAEGRKQARILDAEGEAEATKLAAAAKVFKLAAKGEGNMKAAEALGMSGKDYTAAQVAKKAIGKGDTILGAEGIAQVVGLGKYIFEKPKEEA